MTTQEYKDLYDKMYDNTLVVGKDTEAMQLWGEREKYFVHKMIDAGSEHAKQFILGLESAIEAEKWNNYVSRKEMMDIMATFSPPAKWSYEEIKAFAEKVGVPYENKPLWNCYALVVTMNMLHSDHSKTIMPLVSDDVEYAKVIYKLAIDKLQDPDRKRFLREYFEGILGD